MVAAYSVLSILCAAVSIVLLWPISSLLALAAAPFIASAAVLLAAVVVALRRSSRSRARSTANVRPTAILIASDDS
jgi:hypothetical protein